MLFRRSARIWTGLAGEYNEYSIIVMKRDFVKEDIHYKLQVTLSPAPHDYTTMALIETKTFHSLTEVKDYVKEKYKTKIKKVG